MFCDLKPFLSYALEFSAFHRSRQIVIWEKLHGKLSKTMRIVKICSAILLLHHLPLPVHPFPIIDLYHSISITLHSFACLFAIC